MDASPTAPADVGDDRHDLIHLLNRQLFLSYSQDFKNICTLSCPAACCIAGTASRMRSTLKRSRGPERLIVAATCPSGSMIGTATDPTPGSRSARLIE